MVENQVDIKKIRDGVLYKLPLLGDVISKLEFEENTRMSTAATNGKKVCYSSEFLGGLSFDEQKFVIAHEIMHVALQHVERHKGKNGYLWNVATDAVINQTLAHQGFTLVEGCVDMPDAYGKSSEEFYQTLLAEHEKNSQNQQNGGQQNNGAQGGAGQQNSSQNGAGQGCSQNPESNSNEQNSGESDQQNGQQMRENNAQNGANQTSGNDQQNGNAGDQQNENNGQYGDYQNGNEGQNGNDSALENGNEGQGGASQGENDQNKEEFGADNKFRGSHEFWDDNAASLDEQNGYSAGKNSAEENADEERDFAACDSEALDEFEKNFEQKNNEYKEEMARQIREKLAERKTQASACGAGHGDRSLGEVGEDKEFSWKKILKNELDKEQIRWSYRRADEENGYSARLGVFDELEKSKVEVLLDTSGSISNDLLRSFLRQLKPLLRDSEMKVGCFDNVFYGFSEIKTNKDIDALRLQGGGGTNFDAAMRAFTKDKKVSKIVFTDGWSTTHLEGREYDNINWLVFENDNFHPTAGKAIKVDKNSIKFLDNSSEQEKSM